MAYSTGRARGYHARRARQGGHLRPNRLLLAAFAALALYACARREEAPGPPRLAWTMQDLQRSWSADADTVPEVWVSLHYPRFTEALGPGAADSLNAWVMAALFAAARTDSAPGDLDGIAREMVANYQSLHREIPGASTAAWYYENEVLVRWDSLGLVSLASTADSYTGGAHGLAVRLHGVIDAATGRRLALSDVVAPESAEELDRLAGAAFRAARGLAPDAALDREGFWFEGGRFVLTPNFGLEPQGLVFHYNSFEVAPYVMGPTEVRLRWEDVAGLLRADGPLAALRGH